MLFPPEKLRVLRQYHTRLMRAGIPAATIPSDQLGGLLDAAEAMESLSAPPLIVPAPPPPAPPSSKKQKPARESDADDQC